MKHLHGVIDVAAEIWNHAVVLKNRYYKLFGKRLPEGKLKAHLAKLRRQPIPTHRRADQNPDRPPGWRGRHLPILFV
ncbi:MAG: hypothetical protein JOY92_06170 [Verrucomicrobia bacterium]|nr:hypothetical protein [Verrucomicrobiota bacterium]